ncbi:MAG: hypothetical protein AABZ64_06650 [Nitrospinota bacterium]
MNAGDAVAGPPPLAGGHSHAILREALGMGAGEIARLKERGVV